MSRYYSIFKQSGQYVCYKECGTKSKLFSDIMLNIRLLVWNICEIVDLCQCGSGNALGINISDS